MKKRKGMYIGCLLLALALCACGEVEKTDDGVVNQYQDSNADISPTESLPEVEEVTATPEPTVTSTPVPTVEPEPTETVTPTPTVMPEPTATVTPVPTATPEPTATSTPVPTATEVPTDTATPEPTATPKPTSTPAPTATPKPTATPTPSKTIAETVNINSTKFEVPWVGGTNIIANMRVAEINSSRPVVKVEANDSVDLSCGWKSEEGNYIILPDGWDVKWYVDTDIEAYLKLNTYTGDYGTTNVRVSGRYDMPYSDEEIEAYVYADLIASDGSTVTTLKRLVKIDASNGTGSSNTSTGSSNTSTGSTTEKEETTTPSTTTGTYKYTTDQGEEIKVSAKEYAILTKDYSQISAKEIIKYYVELEQYGNQVLQESEAECQKILELVDAALDEVWEYGGEYITGDEYFSIPYRLALQCEMLMSLTYAANDENTEYLDSGFMNNSGIRQDCTISISYSYGNNSKTGTGKYFNEAFINHKTDCLGGDLATQLLINRAAHRAGLEESELYAYGVQQGDDHKISIICIEGYYATYGYNEILGQIKSTSHIPNFSKSKVFVVAGELRKTLFFNIGDNGELYRVTDIEYMKSKTKVDAHLIDGTKLDINFEKNSADKLIIPDYITEARINNTNTTIKSVVIGKNVKEVGGFTNLKGIEEIEILGTDVSIELNIATPWAQSQIEKYGYITIPEGIKPHKVTSWGCLHYIDSEGNGTSDIFNIPGNYTTIVYEDVDMATWEFTPTYPWGWTLCVSADEQWWAEWCEYWGVPYITY